MVDPKAQEVEFPSGPWMGYWNHQAAGVRFRQELDLTFRNGRMAGNGFDSVGRFLIKGGYDPEKREVWWTKTYPESHDVFYKGFREGKGIWGTWNIDSATHGGFMIWPRALGEGEGWEEAIVVEDSEAVSNTVAQGPEVGPDTESLP